MSVKYRIVESNDCQFYPQAKVGWLDPWRFFACDADMSVFFSVRHMTTKDPGKAAKFSTDEEAKGFILRVQDKLAAGYADFCASEARAASGVKARRVIKF